MRGQPRPSNSAGPAGPGETMKILVLNPFAGGMQELERCRQVAGPDTEIVFEDISEKCVEEDGAEAILMGCTLQSCPLTVTGVDDSLGAPIIDPVLVGVKFTEFMVEAKRVGLPILSRFGTWRKPPADEVKSLRRARASIVP